MILLFLPLHMKRAPRFLWPRDWLEAHLGTDLHLTCSTACYTETNVNAGWSHPRPSPAAGRLQNIFYLAAGLELRNAGKSGSSCNSVVYCYCYGLNDRGSRVRFPAGAGNFSLHHHIQNGSGAHQSPIQWVPGAISLGVNRSEREADHSPPSNAEVK
jgi:hypothetical protein